MDEIEVNQVENLEAPAPETTPDPAAPNDALPPEPAKPAPELTLRQKIEKKAAEVAARDAAATPATPGTPQKDPKTGKFLPKTGAPATPPVTPDPAAQTGETGEKTGETPAFSPNFKFKVMDKEHEVPKFLQDSVKTPEDEKQLRELMEKAYGLDIVKPKFQETREQLRQATGNFQNLAGQIQEARALYQAGDMDAFFKRINVSEEKVLQWMVDKINYNQLPQDQKNVIDQRRAAEDRAREAETRATQAQSDHEQLLSQQVQMALDIELAKPDVQQVAQAFDARRGNGAFQSEIARRGHFYWSTEGKLVPPAQVVKELMEFLGPISAPAPAPSPQAEPTAPAASAPAPAAPKPVVPNISGRSASAVKTTIRSIDDIKKRAKELSASN